MIQSIFKQSNIYKHVHNMHIYECVVSVCKGSNIGL